jgi:hypothetical protein
MLFWLSIGQKIEVLHQSWLIYKRLKMSQSNEAIKYDIDGFRMRVYCFHSLAHKKLQQTETKKVVDV